MANLLSGIIGAIGGMVLGAFSSMVVAVWLRNSDKRKLFEEEIGEIKAKFLLIDPKEGIESIGKLHEGCLSCLSSAVYRTRPYFIRNSRRERLVLLLNKFRDARQNNEGGFVPKNLSGNYKEAPSDLFSDPVRAREYLIKILDDMGE